MQLISAPGPNRLRLTRVPERLLAHQLLRSLAQAYSYHFLQVNPTSVIISRGQAHRGEDGVDSQKVSQLIAQDIIEEVVDGLMNVWEGKVEPVVESLSTSESAEEAEAKEAESTQWTTTIHRLPELADLQSISALFTKLLASSGPSRIHLRDVPQRLLIQDSSLLALAQAYGFDFEQVGPATAVISKAQEHSGEASVDQQKVSELITQDFEVLQEELVDGLMKIWDGQVPKAPSTEESPETEAKEEAVAPESEQALAENSGDDEGEEVQQEPQEAMSNFHGKKQASRAQTLKPRQASKNLPHGSKIRTTNGQWFRHVSNKPAFINTEAKRLIQEARMEMEPVQTLSSYDEDSSSSQS